MKKLDISKLTVPTGIFNTSGKAGVLFKDYLKSALKYLNVGYTDSCCNETFVAEGQTSGGGLESVTGFGVDNTDPLNPVITAPYKVYSALLTNSSGTVTAIQLQNTIGDGSGDGTNDIAWTNPSNGIIRGTMSAGTPFTTDKVWAVFPTLDVSSNAYFVGKGVPALIVPLIIPFDGFVHAISFVPSPLPLPIVFCNCIAVTVPLELVSKALYTL